jgi:hypothetical protein
MPNHPPYDEHALATSISRQGNLIFSSASIRRTLSSVGGRDGYQLDEPHGSSAADSSSNKTSLGRNLG